LLNGITAKAEKCRRPSLETQVSGFSFYTGKQIGIRLAPKKMLKLTQSKTPTSMKES